MVKKNGHRLTEDEGTGTLLWGVVIFTAAFFGLLIYLVKVTQ